MLPELRQQLPLLSSLHCNHSPLQSLSTELDSLQAVAVPVVALVVLLEEEVGEGINLPTAQLESAVTIALTSSQQFPGSGSAFAPYH